MVDESKFWLTVVGTFSNSSRSKGCHKLDVRQNTATIWSKHEMPPQMRSRYIFQFVLFNICFILIPERRNSEFPSK